ncbi:hypothetical protein [Longirhabdus pacifica]|uniref:hypothetical protein n=1 Tax=Longirhabdus pacifica TaxID=2305227 RepID=UPI003F991080
MLTPQLEILAEIDDYESLIFTRRWHDVGDFYVNKGEIGKTNANAKKVGKARNKPTRAN